MVGRLVWVHSETGDLHARSVEAEQAALAQVWPEGPDGNRLFRAWLLTQCATLARLGGNPLAAVAEGATFLRGLDITQSGPPYMLDIVPAERTDDFDWQMALLYSLGSVVSRGHLRPDELTPTEDRLVKLRTIDGDDPVYPTLPTATAAMPVVAGVVIVLCAGILAGTVGWVTAQKNEVASLELAQLGKTTQAIAAMTSATQMLEQHGVREATEQRVIPYSQQEMQLFDTLQSTIRSTAGWTPPPLRSAPNVAGMSEKLGTSTSIGTLALFGVGALLLYQTLKQ